MNILQGLFRQEFGTGAIHFKGNLCNIFLNRSQPLALDSRVVFPSLISRCVTMSGEAGREPPFKKGDEADGNPFLLGQGHVQNAQHDGEGHSPPTAWP